MKTNFIFLALLFVLCEPAFAKEGSENMESIGFIVKIIGSVFSSGNTLVASFQAQGLVIALKLNDGALILAGLLLTASMAWEIIMDMKDDKSPVSGVVENLLYGSLVVFLIKIYPTIISDATSLGSYVMDKVSTDGFSGAVNKLIQSFFVTTFQTIGSEYGKVWNLGNAWDMLVKAGDAIVAFIIAFFVMILCLLALAEIFGVVFVAPVILGLAVALGPLFIATLASSWTRSWFEQWINFLINAVMLMSVLTIVLVLISTALVPTLNAATSAGTSLSGPMLVMGLFALAMGKVISGVPSYADGLFPGRTSAAKGSASAKEMGNIAKPVQKKATDTAKNLYTRAKNILAKR